MFRTKGEGSLSIFLFKFYPVITSVAFSNSLKYAGLVFQLRKRDNAFIPLVRCGRDHRMWGTSHSAGHVVGVVLSGS